MRESLNYWSRLFPGDVFSDPRLSSAIGTTIQCNIVSCMSLYIVRCYPWNIWGTK